MKKLIVLEGLDGTGKSTQAQLLKQNLTALGKKVYNISFPDYESKSSELVKMYLNGEFGQDANSVNPYAASTFFAIDRYASYQLKWKQAYLSEDFIIADRYTTSNIIHQMSKLSQNEWNGFVQWLYEFEYNKLKLPKPSLIIYLDLKLEISKKLLEERKKEAIFDLHESNIEYLKSCKNIATYVVEHFGWKTVRCFKQNTLKTKSEIAQEVLTLVQEWLKETGG